MISFIYSHRYQKIFIDHGVWIHDFEMKKKNILKLDNHKGKKYLKITII